jgi:cytochrome c oxidase cbb3-type subunit 1
MDWFIRAFIRASLLWFALAIAAGVAIAVYPAWIIYRPAHAHLAVVGFLTMLVFGVGYQLLPRLFGHPLHSARVAVAHLYAANIGLGALVVGFIARPHTARGGAWLLGAGGVIFATGVGFWIWNLWRTFDAADARQRNRPEPGSRRLPTAGQ